MRLIDSKNNEVQTNQKPDPDYVWMNQMMNWKNTTNLRLNRITAMDLKSLRQSRRETSFHVKGWE